MRNQNDGENHSSAGSIEVNFDTNNTNNQFLGKKILIICHSYNNFQKDAIECTSNSFKEIYVFVRTNPFAEISNIIPISHLERYKISNKIDLLNKPSNINVYPTPICYFPIDISYKGLGYRHASVVKRTIHRFQTDFDLVHSHFTWSSGYVGAILRKERNVPFVVTAHGDDIYALPFKDDKWKKKIEYVLNTANHIITVSHRNYDCIKKLKISTPVTVIPNGFNNTIFRPSDSLALKKKLGLPLDKKIILTVGNFEPVKGHKYLINAINKIISIDRDVHCIFVGSGKLNTTLKKQIRSLELDKYFSLVGNKPHKEISQWINACDLFVLPSLNEGNPTVMFEALGCGKPFVGTRVGGVPEIIISDDYGYLVEPNDSDNLADKILMALNRKWNSDKILDYAGQYTWENISKQILNVYKNVLETNP